MTVMFCFMQLGGVVKPNDGKCHMTDSTPNADGTIDYDKWDELVSFSYSPPKDILSISLTFFPQDFPSIGQIAEKLDEFDIIPIFAVVRNFQDLYGVQAITTFSVTTCTKCIGITLEINKATVRTIMFLHADAMHLHNGLVTVSMCLCDLCILTDSPLLSSKI